MTRFARRTNLKPENNEQKNILQFLDDMETLAKKPIYYFRSWAGAFKTDGGFFKTGRAWCPDITLLVNWKYIGMEIKAPWKTQSVKQKEAEQQIKKAGGEYYVVFSVDQVKTILAKHIDLY